MASGARLVALLEAGQLEILDQLADLGTPARRGGSGVDWRLGPRRTDRLWTVTLHYHGWAWELARVVADGCDPDGLGGRAAALFRDLVADWIEHCRLERPGSAGLAWNAYAVATRLGFWLRCHRAVPALFAEHPDFERSFLRSAWAQSAYLADHLEWDVRANHLLRDLAGLATAGRFFAEPTAREWLARAGRLATDQVAEQLLDDGGHYERSPKYHHDVMHDLLCLGLLAEEEGVRRRCRTAWAAMAEWAVWMRHPDGGTPHFNDGAILDGEDVVERLEQGGCLGIVLDPGPRRGGRFFGETGQVVWHGPRWSLFFDVGPLGPDHQPGHGHADQLNLECSFAGRRLVVDPGAMAYDDDERRRYDRSTRAHNTICIDGLDSSEMWQIFRVGRRARPRDVAVELREDGLDARASHTGYDRLAGSPRHSRVVRLREQDHLTVIDRVAGTGEHHLEGGFLIDPSWQVRPTTNGWTAAQNDRRVDFRLEGPAACERFAEPGWQHPRYGVEREATRVGWRFSGRLPCEVRWSLGGG